MPEQAPAQDPQSGLHPAWLGAASSLQRRLAESVELLPREVRDLGDLFGLVRGLLSQAIKDGRLKTSAYALNGMLKECVHPSARLQKELAKVPLQKDERLRILLGAGNADGTRFSEDPSQTAHFVLADGARLDFSITLREGRQGASLEGYIFSLTFPGDHPTPPFLRLDMNLSNHRNDLHGLRVHLHPGSNDLQVPVPWMSLSEVFTFVLYGLPWPERPQHDQA